MAHDHLASVEYGDEDVKNPDRGAMRLRDFLAWV